MTKPFWQEKSLEAMTHEEWETLCDGCGKCCLHKIEDVDSGEVFFTNVACRLLDASTCRCRDYAHRTTLVPGCVVLEPQMVREIAWLPETCAYRRLAEGRGLAWWHPLVSGTQETVRQAGIAICDRTIPEESIDISKLEDYVIDWIV